MKKVYADVDHNLITYLKNNGIIILMTIIMKMRAIANLYK